MPSLGPDMESARVIEWLVKPGDTLHRGDVIVVVETDKGAIEIEVFEDAVVEALIAPLDAELVVGAVMARLRVAGESRTDTRRRRLPATDASSRPSQRHPRPGRGSRRPPSAVIARTALEPAAHLSQAQSIGAPGADGAKRGVGLATITGSGPQGAVLLADVGRRQRAAREARRRFRCGRHAPRDRRGHGPLQARNPPLLPGQGLESRWRRGAGCRGQRSVRSVEARLLPAVLLLRAVGLALARTPGLNGFFEEGGFRAGDGVHVGWAVALRGGGLLAPAIHDVDKKGLDELMTALRDVVMRARGGGLRSSEMMDATVTVTSLGERGADSVLPIIHPPQVAMLGFGRIVERAWVVEGRVVPQPVVRLSLAADHRVSDGHLGSQLLADIERLLNAPEQL